MQFAALSAYLGMRQFPAGQSASCSLFGLYSDAISCSVKGGKLKALEYVRTLFGIPQERCIAAGDSGNDILMLKGGSDNTTPIHMCQTMCSRSTTSRVTGSIVHNMAISSFSLPFCLALWP